MFVFKTVVLGLYNRSFFRVFQKSSISINEVNTGSLLRFN